MGDLQNEEKVELLDHELFPSELGVDLRWNEHEIFVDYDVFFESN
jgi:hypothetical protein